MTSRSRLKRGGIATVPFFTLLAGLPIGAPSARGAVDNWTGAVNTQWNNAGNWSAGIPNSPSTSVSITDPTNNSVLISGIIPTIGGQSALTLGASDSLSIGNNVGLTIATGSTINNAGTILLNSTGSFTDILLSGSNSTVTFTGGGSITMSNQTSNNIYSTVGATLINDTSNTIQGAGGIGLGSFNSFAFNNKGTVNANVSNALAVSPSQPVINTGLLEATAGGKLNLQSAVTNTGGTILAAGANSTVNLSGTSITGGTFTTTAGGAINTSFNTLIDVAISPGSTLTIPSSSSATLQGTIANSGTIAVGSTGGFGTDLLIGAATVTLTGGGSIAMSNRTDNAIYSTAGGTLVNDTNNTIQGAGSIGLGNAFTLINKGTVNAKVSNPLTVNPTRPVISTGLLEASAGGRLKLSSPVTNTGGTIFATGANSVVSLSGSTITGGTLATNLAGTIDASNGTLVGVTINSGSVVTVASNAPATLQGTISNAGTIALGTSSGFGSELLIGPGTVTHTGGGSITMANQTGNYVHSNSGGILVNDTGNTIQGAGTIGLGPNDSFTFNNKGTVNANVSNALAVDPAAPVINTGLLEATAGGTLNLETAVTNTGGTIYATGANSIVTLSGITVTGGTLSAAQGGIISGNYGTLNAVTISPGTTVSVGSSAMTLAGVISNGGTISLTGSSPALTFDSGTVTHTGGGSIAMSSQAGGAIYSTAGGTFINDTNNTIQGPGSIGLAYSFKFNNMGTVNANSSNGLTVNIRQAVTNTGLLEATAGGTLNLQTPVINTGGTILATGANSLVNLSGSTITDGTLTTSLGGRITTGYSTLGGITISPGSNVLIDSSATATLSGTVTNNGAITLSTFNSAIQIFNNLTFAGSGSVTMAGGNAIIYGQSVSHLTNGANHTIQGSGQIGDGQMSVVNNGTFLANQTSSLTVQSDFSGATNNGTFQANSGSTLYVNGTLTNYSNATHVLTGGAYNCFSGAINLFQAQTISGNVIATNSATIVLDGPAAKIGDRTGTNMLRGFLATNTAAGSFTIQNAASLTSATSGFTNAGTLNIGANSTFTVGGAHDYLQTGGLTNLGSANATLAVAAGHSVNITGGLLEGQGIIQGNLVDSGIVHPGESPGILEVIGSDTQNASGHLEIDIGGVGPGTGYSELIVSGPASLGGTLDLSLINGFTPTDGEHFVILTSSGLSGTFANVTGLTEGNVTFTVTYSPPGFANDVVLNASVPEPASVALLGFAGAAAFVVRRRPRTCGK